MDKSPEQEVPGLSPTTVEAAAQIKQPEQKRVRRKLVQSTLFPHNSPEIANSGGNRKLESETCNVDGEEGEDEEYCGSQSKKKRTRKEKTTATKSKAPRKLRKSSSANSTPKKNATPKNDGKNEGEINACSQESIQIPNLRLEAKLKAEEYKQMFPSKQIHPFFSSWKAAKRQQQATEFDSNGCQAERKNTRITIGPIHVFERDKNDAETLDWVNWEVCEKSFADGTCCLEGPFSSVFEGSAEVLSINNYAFVSNPSPIYPVEDNLLLDKYSSKEEFSCGVSATVSGLPSFADVACNNPVVDAETGCEIVASSQVKSSDTELQTGSERVMSSNLGCTKVENKLWTDKYCPEKADEVCGNVESVKFVNEWLHTWHQGGHQASQESFSWHQCDMDDADYECSQGDSDSENIGGGRLKNVLLICGPVGSGKSAAIYACAKEQGFKVLEVNASDYRNGAVVKLKFGEALESRHIQWSQDGQLESQKNVVKFPTCNHSGKMVDLSITQEIDNGGKLIDLNITQEFDNKEADVKSAFLNGTLEEEVFVEQEFDNKEAEVIPISDDEYTDGPAEISGDLVCSDQGQMKPLILFEDVDIIFPEDRGFIAAIQQITKTAKGPVILTCSGENPLLPDILKKLEVNFTVPSEKELLQRANMVCSAEETNIQQHLLEQLIKDCKGDIRKTIMHLQFWFQGKQLRKGRAGPENSRLLLFNLEAAHLVLPKLIPWDCPFQLSELIEKEIAMSMSTVDDISSLKEVEDVTEKAPNNSEMSNGNVDSIEIKKKRMLMRNSFNHDYNDLVCLLFDPLDVNNSSDAPNLFSQRNSRRKRKVVSSDSNEEEDHNLENFPSYSDKNMNNGLVLGVTNGYPSCPNTHNFLSPSTNLQFIPEEQDLVRNHYQCPEMSIDFNAEETCKSFDLSCVPESTFVPETEIDNGMEMVFGEDSCNQIVSVLEEVSVSDELKKIVSPAVAENGKCTSKLSENMDMDIYEGTCNMTTVSSHEEVEDSQNQNVEPISRVQLLMDEYSYIDPIRKTNTTKKPKSCTAIDVVRESWRKLRDRRSDLGHLVTAELRDGFVIMELACGMSNLISETELFQSKCKLPDFLDQSMDCSETSDSSSWCHDQLTLMAMTISEHGFCSYAKQAVDIGSKMGSQCKIDLTEMMSSAADMVGTVRDVEEDKSDSKATYAQLRREMSLSENGTSLNSNTRSSLFDIVQSIVPSKSYMTLKGDAFHEYLSSLSHIARSEASRILDKEKTKRRRGRATRNYLLQSFSTEEISLLGQSNSYRKTTPLSTEKDVV